MKRRLPTSQATTQPARSNSFDLERFLDPDEGIQEVTQLIGASQLTYDRQPVLLDESTPNPKTAQAVAASLWLAFKWLCIHGESGALTTQNSSDARSFAQATDRLAAMCTGETLARLGDAVERRAGAIQASGSQRHHDVRFLEHAVAFRKRFNPPVRQTSLAADGSLTPWTIGRYHTLDCPKI